MLVLLFSIFVVAGLFCLVVYFFFHLCFFFYPFYYCWSIVIENVVGPPTFPLPTCLHPDHSRPSLNPKLNSTRWTDSDLLIRHFPFQSKTLLWLITIYNWDSLLSTLQNSIRLKRNVIKNKFNVCLFHFMSNYNQHYQVICKYRKTLNHQNIFHNYPLYLRNYSDVFHAKVL